MRATVAISVAPLLGALPAAAFGSGAVAFVGHNRDYPQLGQHLEISWCSPTAAG